LPYLGGESVGLDPRGENHVPHLDDATLFGIEQDLADAHKSFGMGDFSMRGASKSAVRALEILGPVALLSYANARSATGEVKIGPVPLDLGLGIALIALSLFDMAGGYEDDLLNLGIGSFGAYAARTGAAFGASAHPLATQTSGAGGPFELSGAHPGALGAPPPGTDRFVVQQVSRAAA
jgi:hypothetical protein